jgi:hypothetical protein
MVTASKKTRTPSARWPRGVALLHRQLVQQEHERLRRARRRAERGVRLSGRSRSRARPAQGHRAAQLLQPRHPRRRPHQPRADRPALAPVLGSRRRRTCASASWPCGAACTGCCRPSAPARPRLLPRPARHVQLHGLSAAQVDRLREEFGVYLIRSGRMCVQRRAPGSQQHRQRRAHGLSATRCGASSRHGGWRCAGRPLCARVTALQFFAARPTTDQTTGPVGPLPGPPPPGRRRCARCPLPPSTCHRRAPI